MVSEMIGKSLIMQSIEHRERKPARLRTKTGCISCRRRRKKCDERKPTCLACERNFLICGWLDARMNETSSPLRQTHSDAPCGNAAADLSSCSGFQNQYIDGNLTLPQTATSDDKSGALNNVLHKPPKNQVLEHLSSESRVLLEHYFYRTADVMSPYRGDTNPFIYQFMPIAMSHDLVLQSLLALSGLHHREHSPTSVMATTWSHYGQTLKALKYGLTGQASGAECFNVMPLLAATLMLVFIETTRTNTANNVLLHVTAARQLLFSALKLPSSLIDDETRVLLVDIYTYIIITCNITFGIKTDNWVSDDAELLLPLVRTSKMCSCAPELFRLIPLVSTLSQRMASERESLGFCSWETISSVLSTRSTLHHWSSMSSDSETVACSRIYQQALIVYLETNFSNNNHNEKIVSILDSVGTVHKAFDTVFVILDQVPVTSPISTTICWALAILGSCTKDSQHQNMIKQRLLDIASHSGVKHMRETAFFLEKLWSKKGVIDPLSLAQVMKEFSVEVYFV